MVNINLKSSRELIVELEELLESYESANINFDVIKKAHQDRDRALAWLRRNRDENHPQFSHFTSLKESTKELASAYRRIQSLESKVRTRQKEEEEMLDHPMQQFLSQKNTASKRDTNIPGKKKFIKRKLN